ncbi:unnamed protein product [Dibothriocephalus latus]|uniref:Reverse transcriptase domain-containing protein n=1 Tax=Dibothriocephalus latus TaxID=60516 RepID=A0A3P7LHT2_DIBLA|nr:unnamed protein product [Dibothriocephalus latus]
MKTVEIAPARFYGLPKVHKEYIPLRLIVSFCGTSTHGLAKWMCSRFQFLVKTVTFTKQFLELIKHLNLDELMVSFEVVSLFASIPQQPAIYVVRHLLTERYGERDKPPKSENLPKLL